MSRESVALAQKFLVKAVSLALAQNVSPSLKVTRSAVLLSQTVLAPRSARTVSLAAKSALRIFQSAKSAMKTSSPITVSANSIFQLANPPTRPFGLTRSWSARSVLTLIRTALPLAALLLAAQCARLDILLSRANAPTAQSCLTAVVCATLTIALGAAPAHIL